MKPYLSICIPTNGRSEVLKQTLNSIYSNSSIPYSEYEVIVADNSGNDDLRSQLAVYCQHPNFVYKKCDVVGFLNSLYVLGLGNGKLLKLQNNYTQFTETGLSELLQFIKEHEAIKPLIFFKNSGKGFKQYHSFDEFNYDLSFWHTWSTGFSTWHEDFQKVRDLKVNSMFPHLSLFLAQNYKSQFIINDMVYFVNQEVPKKGGYNLFKTFAIDYLTMLEAECSNSHISIKTFEKIKADLFNDFLVTWYYNTKYAKNSYTFDLTDIRSSMEKYYGRNGYHRLRIMAMFFKLKKMLKLIKK